MSPTQTPPAREKPRQNEGSRPPALHPGVLAAADTFVRRHIGPSEAETAEMLAFLGYASLTEFADATVPASIRSTRALRLEGVKDGAGEFETLQRLKAIAS